MGFKSNISFLHLLSIGAVGVHRTMTRLRDRGFKPIELERHCGSNKIWNTKVKRLRLPDLLCTKTGMRFEVRAKTNLEIRMSDAPNNPERAWDVGLRDDDIVALITSFDKVDGWEAADDAVYFTVGALRASVESSTLNQRKSVSEGAEQDRRWPATIPKRDGTVLKVTDDKIIAHMNDGRSQNYQLKGKVSYVLPGDTFRANSTIIAGTPQSLAKLSTYLQRCYDPLKELQSDNDVDRYAAVKALRFRGHSQRDSVVAALEGFIRREHEERVLLEAAGSAAALGSKLGQQKITHFIWNNSDQRSDLSMEAVFILTELGNDFAREQLNHILADSRFEGEELRQAAVWGLGKAGLKSYEDVFPFIDNADENLALHAISAFGTDVSRSVIDCLVQDLISGRLGRAAAASETLRIIASDAVVNALIAVTNNGQSVSNWVVATLGRLPPDRVRTVLQDSPLLDKVAPMLLFAQDAHWLASEATRTDIAFLLKQDLT